MAYQEDLGSDLVHESVHTPVVVDLVPTPNPLTKASGVLGMTNVQTAIFLGMVGFGAFLMLRKRRR